MPKSEKKVSFRIKFLACVLALYVLVFFFNASLAKQALWDTLYMIYRISPLLIFVFIINLFINKYVTTDIVEKHIGKYSGFKSWIYAIILGIIISGPPYILYPMLGDLKKRGASDSFLAILLFNRNVKIPFIPVMAYYFGIAYTVIISLLIILFSVLSGYFMLVFGKKEQGDGV